MYGKARNKATKTEYYRLHNKLQDLSAAIVSHNKIIDIEKYKAVQAELETYEMTKCKGAILRSKATWAIENDRNTAYFLRLEKYRNETNTVKLLKNFKGDMINSTHCLLGEIYSFYENLYSCVRTDESNVNEFLQCLGKEIDEDDKLKCDNEITEEDIKSALQGMTGNTSPGQDGLTVEFYCQFYN